MDSKWTYFPSWFRSSHFLSPRRRINKGVKSSHIPISAINTTFCWAVTGSTTRDSTSPAITTNRIRNTLFTCSFFPKTLIIALWQLKNQCSSNENKRITQSTQYNRFFVRSKIIWYFQDAQCKNDAGIYGNYHEDHCYHGHDNEGGDIGVLLPDTPESYPGKSQKN